MKGTYGYAIDRKIDKAFSIYCQQLGLIKSKQVENMIKNWLIERGVEIEGI